MSTTQSFQNLGLIQKDLYSNLHILFVQYETMKAIGKIHLTELVIILILKHISAWGISK